MIHRFWEARGALQQTASSKAPDSLWEKDKDGRQEKDLEQAHSDKSVFLNLYTSSFHFQKYLLLPPHHPSLKVLEISRKSCKPQPTPLNKPVLTQRSIYLFLYYTVVHRTVIMPNVTVPLEIAAGGAEVLKQPHALQKNHPRLPPHRNVTWQWKNINSNNCLLQFEVLIKKKKKKSCYIRLRLHLDAISS